MNTTNEHGAEMAANNVQYEQQHQMHMLGAESQKTTEKKENSSAQDYGSTKERDGEKGGGRNVNEITYSPSSDDHSHQHSWLDYVPLPYWLVIPQEVKLLMQKKGNSSTKQTDRNSVTTEVHRRGTHYDDHQQVDVVSHRRAKLDFIRRLLAEVVGTAILVFAHASLRVKARTQALSEEGNAILAGLTLVFLIYSLGEVSGAHFNPVVTFAFAARRWFPWRWLVPYWIAEFAGAIIGGLVVWGFWGPDAYLGSSSVDPLSRFTQTSAMGLECVLTFMLLFTILSVAQQGSIIGVNGSLAVGSVIAVCVGLGAEITGGSMNPFRSLGPAIINGPIKDVWPMVAGPIIGGLLAVAVTFVLSSDRRKRNQNEARMAAMGIGKQKNEQKL